MERVVRPTTKIVVRHEVNPFMVLGIVLLVAAIIILVVIILRLKRPPKPTSSPKKSCEKVDRLCFLAYYEKDQMYKDNLEYFLLHGIYPNMDYLIIVNGTCTSHALKSEKRPNVHVIYRENTGYDFGAYTHALSLLQSAENNRTPYNLDHYKYFFFINSSVRGPYVKHHKEISEWSYQFTDLLQNDVHLVGTTICILHAPHSWISVAKPHVQSMVLVMDRQCLDVLLLQIFHPNFTTNDMWSTIVNKEILLSTYLLEKGWNISCLATKYQGFDYRKITNNINSSSVPYSGDSCYPGAYFGGTHDPYEIVFIKTNRGLPVPT